MLAPNTLLQDRYLVMGLLGQGGMGAVYQAMDRKFGNAVALKETFYNDLQFRQAFSREAKLLNRLRHAALPVVTDYFGIGERQFLVMQYIPGKDLEQLLADRKAQGQGVFMTSQVLRWADQLLDALEYLHSQNPPIIHRDIKPQNLKLTPRGEMILLDFGLAKGLVTHQSEVSQSLRGYTPNYASLEQIRGTGTDARSDIYSIGATIYHLLTGEMPQDALTRIAAILMSQPDPLKPVASLNLEIPAPVVQVIEKAMAPHPDQRYSSAAALRHALRSAASSISPASVHRAQTLTDEAIKVNAADSRQRSGNRNLPPSPVLRPEATQQVVAQVAANPAELQLPDHVIVVLDKADQNKSGKGARENGLQDNDLRLKQLPRKKDVRGKSFFLRKVQQERKKKLAAAQSWKQYGLKALPSSFAISLLITLAISIGVYQVYKTWPGLFMSSADLATTTSTNIGGATLISQRFEALRYYLEIVSSNGAVDRRTIRATGLAPLKGGAKFKFHFTLTEGGYLYIVALGKNSVPQTFLTSQPMPSSGVATNWSPPRAEFRFPDGGQLLMIQKDAESAPFTIIFSKTPLKTPAFLSSQAGRDLSAEERQELMDFRKRYAANTSELVAMKNGNLPYVSVQSPERAANEPIIFDVLIRRQ